MLASVENNQINNEQSSVTNISAIARVDYIMRFSKHTALVIDENYDLTSDVGHQYIAQLAPQDNTSFVSISNKLNDIQIRCRIIEQLFVGEVFDPEVSLAVSLINLVKHNPQKLNIVVGNAHNLSIQLIHELCQLTEIAKKSNILISVLMLALPAAGNMIANHKDLFYKKITIVSAESGQLVSLNSSIFKTEKDWFKFTVVKKWLLVFSVLSVLALIAVYLLMNLDSLVFSKDKLQPNNEAIIANPNSTMSNGKDNLFTNSELMGKQELASTDDILAALYNPNVKQESTEEVIQEASIGEILSAISFQDANEHSPDLVEVEIVEADIKSSITALPDIQDALTTASNGAYYLNQNQGFVVQIVGFSDADRVSQFRNEHFDIDVYVYQRLLSGNTNWVITSPVYRDKELARAALEDLPQRIKAMSPWIKSLSSIHTEVNTFNSL